MHDSIVSSRSSNEGKYYIWFKGASVVAVVNTETLKFKDISIIKSKAAILPLFPRTE